MRLIEVGASARVSSAAGVWIEAVVFLETSSASWAGRVREPFREILEVDDRVGSDEDVPGLLGRIPQRLRSCEFSWPVERSLQPLLGAKQRESARARECARDAVLGGKVGRRLSLRAPWPRPCLRI